MLEPMMKMMVGQQIGSYRLNKFLGAGSFGGVFHASEMVRNTAVQEVAVKVIPDSSDDKLIELQNARKLEHPNLMRGYAVGEFRFMNVDMLYLVMELAQDSLENRIQKRSLSTEEIKKITRDVAQGLHYLHSQNKVHRDLKPGNILTVNQQYKLADFGLIRTLSKNKSHTDTVHHSGTIIYMPPEAFQGNISPQWDVWSLGIMLIEMTTNQWPYQFNNDINQLMAKVMNCELKIPNLPREFKPIIEGCLQRDRKQRWTTQQILNALQPSPPLARGEGGITLASEKNINYQQLQTLLSQGKWREADQQTTNLMLKAIGKNDWRDVEPQDLLNFPVTDLRTMDQLWLKYSNGKFGFSVQKQIWIDCGGTPGEGYNHDVAIKFSDKNGWRKNGSWLRYDQFTFNLGYAPHGHLPVGYYDMRGEGVSCLPFLSKL
jgi:serine/threonine protein kinase